MAGQDNNKGLSHQNTFNIVVALARGHSICFLVFLRRNFGSEALGWPGLMAFLIILAVGSFGRIPEMWPFLGFWFFALVCQRVSTVRAMCRGIIRHSRYEGDVDTKFTKNRRVVKQILEPLVCGAVALFFHYLGCTSNGFVLFLGWGAFSMALMASIDRSLDDRRLQAMRDAAIEQEYLAARYRGEIN